MKALILAAGLGKRMRPLTLKTPKALLKIGQHMLIEHHILALKKSGINEIIINTFWLAEQIHHIIGDGNHYGVSVKYSEEQGEALETAGGIKKAIPLLGSDHFIVINADIYSDYQFNKHNLKNKLAHLILVDNPKHNPSGDFAIKDGLLNNDEHNRLTYSGIGYYSEKLFENVPLTPTPLAPILRENANKGSITAEHFNGFWTDVGTPKRLAELNNLV